MRLASYVLSITLHLGLVLVVFFWPSPPPIKLDSAPVQISLVDGAMGGNRAPSPVLGPQGAKGEKIAPPEVAPQRAETAPPAPVAQETPIAKPQPEMQKPEPQKELPKPKPEPEATPIAEKKKPDVKKEEPKPEPKKEEPKKEEPKKPDPPKAEAKKPEPAPPAKPAVDPIKAALASATKQASSREPATQQGSAITRALAEAKRKAGGAGGGGGGEGDGPGGGGLGDVYIGQVMMAVRPNWGFPSSSRQNLTCSVRVQVDAQGKVLRVELEQSSGNSLFDTSTINAIRKTGVDGQFPVPPSAQYHDLIIAFNLNEMAGR